MNRMFVALTAAGLLGLAAPTPAAAQGIGCEVILCLAGGFPGAECSPAKSYFMKSRRKKKSYNPFKPCKESDDSEYDIPTNWFTQTRTECPGGIATQTDRDGTWQYCRGGYKRFTDYGVKIWIPDTPKSYQYIYRTFEITENDK